MVHADFGVFFQANSLRFSDWHLGFSRIPISSSNTGTSTKSKPIYVPPLILTGFYTWGVSCQYRYILLQSSTFVDASQDTFGCDTKIIWRTTGWTAGGIDKDLGCLIGYLLGSVILVADPWLQGLVTKILQGAGTHNAQTPRKIYCRVFSEEACGQFSIRFVHKCIVWIEKFATERSYPCHLQRRLRLHTSRCDIARSSYPTDANGASAQVHWMG